MRVGTWIGGAVVTALVLAAVASSAGPRRAISFTAVIQSQHTTTTTRVVHDADYLGSTQIGTDVLTCKAATSTCTAVFTFFTLPKGTITVRSVGQGVHGSGPITGGTGTYANVKGTYTYVDLTGSGAVTGITIELA